MDSYKAAKLIAKQEKSWCKDSLYVAAIRFVQEVQGLLIDSNPLRTSVGDMCEVIMRTDGSAISFVLNDNSSLALSVGYSSPREYIWANDFSMCCAHGDSDVARNVRRLMKSMLQLMCKYPKEMKCLMGGLDMLHTHDVIFMRLPESFNRSGRDLIKKSEKVIPYLGNSCYVGGIHNQLAIGNKPYIWPEKPLTGVVVLTAKMWGDGHTELVINDDDDMDIEISSGMPYEYYVRYMNNLSVLNIYGVLI